MVAVTFLCIRSISFLNYNLKMFSKYPYFIILYKHLSPLKLFYILIMLFMKVKLFFKRFIIFINTHFYHKKYLCYQIKMKCIWIYVTCVISCFKLVFILELIKILFSGNSLLCYIFIWKLIKISFSGIILLVNIYK